LTARRARIVRRMKRVADTSRASRRDLEPSRRQRELDVVDALQRCCRTGSDPTAYELLRWMQVENPVLDLNAVRPRLSELRDAGRVETTGKRRCQVTGKRVYTWAVMAVAPAPCPALTSAAAAVQEPLF
jgi:hypothetical protein